MPILPPADRSLRRAYGRDPRVSGVCAGESATGSYYSPRDSHCLSGVWPLPDVRVVPEGLAESPGTQTGGDRAVLTHDERAAGSSAGGVSDTGC